MTVCCLPLSRSHVPLASIGTTSRVLHRCAVIFSKAAQRWAQGALVSIEGPALHVWLRGLALPFPLAPALPTFLVEPSRARARPSAAAARWVGRRRRGIVVLCLFRVSVRLPYVFERSEQPAASAPGGPPEGSPPPKKDGDEASGGPPGAPAARYSLRSKTLMG